MTDWLNYWGLKIQAILLLLAGQPAKAREKFQFMAAQWPRDRYALASLAHVSAQLGDKHAAVHALDRLTRAFADNPAAWFNLGFMLEDMGRHGEGESAFRRALEIDPRMDRAWYGLALILIQQRRFDEAVLALKKNTELQPMSPYGWYQLARVHVDRQEPDEAAKIIRHLKGFEPKVAAQLERETGLKTAQAS
jgi:tetratricopeptide (TPR) repeat protein